MASSTTEIENRQSPSLAHKRLEMNKNDASSEHTTAQTQPNTKPATKHNNNKKKVVEAFIKTNEFHPIFMVKISRRSTHRMLSFIRIMNISYIVRCTPHTHRHRHTDTYMSC